MDFAVGSDIIPDIKLTIPNIITTKCVMTMYGCQGSNSGKH